GVVGCAVRTQAVGRELVERPADLRRRLRGAGASAIATHALILRTADDHDVRVAQRRPGDEVAQTRIVGFHWRLPHGRHYGSRLLRGFTPPCARPAERAT